MEEAIPEYRRGQLEVSHVQVETKKASFASSVRQRMRAKYYNSEFYQKLLESDEMKDYEQVPPPP